MPFYEYQCTACGHTLEEMQKITAAPLKKCPECGKSSLQRLMSAPVFRLKGGGWYETDFKTDQDSKRNLADRPDGDAPKEDAKDAKDSKESKESKEGAAPAAKEEASGDNKGDKKADKKGEKSGDKPAEKSAGKSANKAGRDTASGASVGGKKAAAAKPSSRRAAPVARKSKPKGRTAKPVKKARR